MALHIGTSGWHYAHWKARGSGAPAHREARGSGAPAHREARGSGAPVDGRGFYPPGCPSGRWLAHYARRFATVEINATFYRLTAAETLAGWRDAVPDDFVFAVKASRYLSHVRRLRDPEGPVELLLERSSALGAKRGPILVQLPPDMTVEVDRLDRALAAFGGRAPVAVEVRHRSWDHPEVRAVLESHGAALVLADRRGPLAPQWRTAPWTYVRFHEGRGRDRPCYGPRALDSWIGRLREGWPEGDVWAYFNNDQAGCAPEDAARFERRWERPAG